MKKQRRFLVLLWAFGYTLFFSCGALAYDYPPNKVSLVADFGAQGGLWLYGDSAGWSQLTDASSNLMVSIPETRMLGAPWTITPGALIANFPGHGLYVSHGTSWYQLTPNDGVENLVKYGRPSVDSPWASHQIFDIYGDYGSLGVWKYDGQYGVWSQITVANPDQMKFHIDGLVANFPGDGLYLYNADASRWTQLTPNSSAENLLAPCGKVYADFGSLGLWQYDGEWHNLSYANPDKMKALGCDLIANFPGHGLYWYDGTAWTQLTPNDTVQTLIVASNWLSAGTLYADYGPLGLWKWKYNDSWDRISFADANLLGTYGYSGNLVANFPGDGGLYQYNGSSWAPLTDNSGVKDMIGVDF